MKQRDWERICNKLAKFTFNLAMFDISLSTRKSYKLFQISKQFKNFSRIKLNSDKIRSRKHETNKKNSKNKEAVKG
jgi:hypothetical protein